MSNLLLILSHFGYVLVSCVFGSQLVVDFGTGPQQTIEYNNTVDCNIIQSQNVSESVRCLALCQSTLCKSLQFDASTKSCTLFGSDPSLIEFDSLIGLNISYVLGMYKK